MTIDDYLTIVCNALTNPAAQTGIEDLHAALEERAATIDQDAACARVTRPFPWSWQHPSP